MRIRAFVLCILAVALAGCCAPGRPTCQVHRIPLPEPGWEARARAAEVQMAHMATLPSAPHALIDGQTGGPIWYPSLPKHFAGADVVLFGELHGNLVGAAYQLTVLRAMHRQGRPLALAMEFLERDVQPAVDRYLQGEIDETTFKKDARLGKAYPKTHRPLIEFCKANRIPVIAANAPRPLVKAYRKTEVDYATYLDSLTDDERRSLPRTTSTPDGPYKDRFFEFMGPKRGPSFFRSQALWDDAMAEAVTDWRDAHPSARVLLIVGAFHVRHGGGTLTKIQARRPADRIATIAMDMTAPPLTFTTEDRGMGDVILKVEPPKKTKKDDAPTPPKS